MYLEITKMSYKKGQKKFSKGSYNHSVSYFISKTKMSQISVILCFQCNIYYFIVYL